MTNSTKVAATQTIELLSNSESYWLRAAAKWAKDIEFHMSEERVLCAFDCNGPLLQCLSNHYNNVPPLKK
jgi:hypothetical protein